VLLLAVVADQWLGTTTVTVGPHANVPTGDRRARDDAIASTDIVKIDLHITCRPPAAPGLGLGSWNLGRA